MNENELRFYEAGIKDANEARCITTAARSKRACELLAELRSGINRETVRYLDAYNAGVAYEINRQIRLEF